MGERLTRRKRGSRRANPSVTQAEREVLRCLAPSYALMDARTKTNRVTPNVTRGASRGCRLPPARVHIVVFIVEFGSGGCYRLSPHPENVRFHLRCSG